MEHLPQQISDYINQHLNQGFSETDVRSHLLTNGWSHEAVNQAFERYNRTVGSSPSMAARQSLDPRLLQHQHSAPKKRRKSILKWVMISVGIIVIAVVMLFVYLAKSPSTLDKLATPALQRNADNTKRENDAAMIASALATYISSHQNTFPQSTATDTAPKTLDVCGPDCTSAYKVTVQLGYYANTPSAVSFRNYATNLKVPDLKTVYIVPNANCKSDKSGIGTSTVGEKYLSIVVLYAIQSGTAVKQQCLSPY